MAVTGWKVPGTITEDTSAGSNPLLNYANLSGTGSTKAEIDWGSGSPTSYRYKATNFGFTTGDIPSGATVDGIEFGYARHEVSSTDNLSTSEINIIKSDGTVITGTNKADAGEWPNHSSGTPPDAVTVGGATDLMGYTGVTSADIRDSDFGVRWRAAASSGTTPAGFVNGFQMRVYYTLSGTDYPESVSDSFTMQDTVDNIRGHVTTNTESFALDDTVASVATYTGSFTESFNMQDVVTPLRDAPLSLSDSFNLNDNEVDVAGVTVSLSDSFVGDDSITAVKGFVDSVSDSFVGDDTVASKAEYTGSFTESFNMQDAVDVSRQMFFAVDDSFVGDDTVANLKGHNLSVSDSFVGDDTQSDSRGMNTSLSDSFTQDDTVANSLGVNQSLSDSYAMQDTVAGVRGFVDSGTDSFTLNDEVVDALNEGSTDYEESVSDSFTMQDTGDGSRNIFDSVSDSVAMQDVVSEQKAMVNSTTDSFTLADTEADSLAITINLSDSTQMNDSETSSTGYNHTVADSFTTQDTVANSKGYNENVSDSAAISDTVNDVGATATDRWVVSDSEADYVEISRRINNELIYPIKAGRTNRFQIRQLNAGLGKAHTFVQAKFWEYLRLPLNSAEEAAALISEPSSYVYSPLSENSTVDNREIGYQYTRAILTDGDSIISTANSPWDLPLADRVYSQLYVALGSQALDAVINVGVGGKTIEELGDDAPAKIDNISWPDGCQRILVIMAGTNDINSGGKTAAQTETLARAYIQDRLNAIDDLNVIFVTQIARLLTTEPTAKIMDYNARMIAAASADGYTIAPVSASPFFDQASDTNSSDYQADNEHPTAQGAGKIATIIAAAINAL